MPIDQTVDSNPHLPNTIDTPEGDNEFAPDQPLAPETDDAEQIPPGFDQQDQTQAYKQDTPLKGEEHHEPTGLEKVIDEISHGKLIP